MALAEKYAALTVVPWFCSAEWRFVCDLIYGVDSSNERKKQALDIMHIWKHRVSLLCSGVEGTIIVLEALFLELQESDTKESILQGAYASAIMRFINVCINVKDTKITMLDLAKKYNIPTWVIKIRHEFAHDQKLPPLFTCKKALLFGLDWLKVNYWYKEYRFIKDCIVEAEVTKRNEQIDNLLKLHCDITLILLETAAENVDDLSSELSDRILYGIGSKLEKGWKQNSTILDIQKVIMKQLSKFFHSNLYDISNILFDYLVQINYLNKNEELSKDFIKGWEAVLKLLYESKQILGFLYKLQDETNSKQTNNSWKKLCCLWIKEILAAILKAKDFQKCDATLDFGAYESFYDKNMKPFLQYTLKTPNKHVAKYLNKIMDICALPDHNAQTITSIFKIYKNSLSNVGMEVDADHTSNIDEVESGEHDDNQEPSLCTEWTLLTDETYFQSIPLGMLPNSKFTINPLLDKS